MSWEPRVSMPAITLGVCMMGAALPSWSDGKEPLQLVKLDARPGKELLKAAYGKDGRLGMFHDIDGDAHVEFVSLNPNGDVLELTVLELDEDRESVHVAVGEGSPAGLIAVNLDEDRKLEFIVGYGSRAQENLKKGLIMFASTLGAMAGVYAQFQAGAGVAWYLVVVPGVGTDLYDVAAFDDNGTRLWHRDLQAGQAAGTWGNTRFQSMLPGKGGSGGVVLLTDDKQQALIGLSEKDGTTLWSRPLGGDIRASKLRFNALVDDTRLLPVLHAPEGILILDPQTGKPILEKAIVGGIGALPCLRIFGQGDAKGFLVLGEKGDELRMVSLNSGETLWSHTMDKIRDVIPISDGSRILAVWKEGIKIFDPGGRILLNRPAPDKIKTVFSPVYQDLNGDGMMEFVFVSGKRIVCWDPEADKVLWTAGLGGFVGGVNPVGLYDAFYDLDRDGWLDVPARKGSGSGLLLSGKSGEELASVMNGSNIPVIGDWDEDGKAEVFWWKDWYEVEPR